MNSGSTATNVLCNHDAVAVDQDPDGIQGICVATNGSLQVWRKPLGGSNSTTVAVVLFNRGTNSGSITANWSDIGLPAGAAKVWDIWAQAYAPNATNSYTATVPAQSVQFLRIASIPAAPPLIGTPNIVGGNVVFSVSGGTANATCHVLTSTNLNLPRSQWTILATNTFDAGGHLVFTNSINPQLPALYYCVQQ
jgi:hypothetical protein